ncbi:MAG TPA: hypothetical protein VFD82_12875 [Planctomycetota bacterium]|nr:hypothetical protein [Planctomycetota bacterium]
MSGVRATVKNGRLVVDEPTSLPEGTVLDLVVDDEGDDLDATERALRDEALVKAWRQAQSGLGRPAQDVLNDLRRR